MGGSGGQTSEGGSGGETSGGGSGGQTSGGGSSGESSDGGGGDGTHERSLEVAGPTLGDDYPEYFGNIYLGDRAKCAYFDNTQEYDVRVDAVSVKSPLRVVSGCAPDSGDPEHLDGRGCTPDTVLAASRGNGCTAGVEFENGTDFMQNYLRSLLWQLSVLCTDTEGPPCSDPSVVAAEPTPDRPLRVHWTMTIEIRFCGATDYADDAGDPGGQGGPPSDGCSVSWASS